MVTILTTLFRVPITLLIITHEPPSMLCGKFLVGGHTNGDGRLAEPGRLDVLGDIGVRTQPHPNLIPFFGGGGGGGGAGGPARKVPI